LEKLIKKNLRIRAPKRVGLIYFIRECFCQKKSKFSFFSYCDFASYWIGYCSYQLFDSLFSITQKWTSVLKHDLQRGQSFPAIPSITFGSGKKGKYAFSVGCSHRVCSCIQRQLGVEEWNRWFQDAFFTFLMQVSHISNDHMLFTWFSNHWSKNEQSRNDSESRFMMKRHLKLIWPVQNTEMHKFL